MKPSLYLSLLLGLSSLAAGAAGPAAAEPGAKPAVAASKSWSPYQRVKRPEVPAVRNKAWVRTPIDAFVLAQLEAKGLKPSPDADRAAYIRRATLDAWGLLPTPEAVKAFVEDRSPNGTAQPRR